MDSGGTTSLRGMRHRMHADIDLVERRCPGGRRDDDHLNIADRQE